MAMLVCQRVFTAVYPSTQYIPCLPLCHIDDVAYEFEEVAHLAHSTLTGVGARLLSSKYGALPGSSNSRIREGKKPKHTSCGGYIILYK